MRPAPAAARWLVVLLVLAGVVLRCVQYFAAATLPLGDLALARNLTERSLIRLLTEPAAFAQVILPGYMLLQKAALAVAGNGDVALRLIPWLASLGSLWLFVLLARRWLTGWGLVLAVACLALGIPYLLYSGQVKPFGSVDVFGALGIWVLSFRLMDAPTTGRARLLAAAAGLFLIFFSQSAPLVALAVAGVVLVEGVREAGDSLRGVRPVVLVWILAAAGALAFQHYAMDPAARPAFENFYNSGYFPPFPHVKTQLVWIGRVFPEAFGQLLFQFPIPVLWCLGTLAGAVLLLRRSLRDGILLFLPVVVALLASMLHVYEFRGYWMLGFFPVFFVALGELVSTVAEWTDRVSPAAATGWGLACLALPVVRVSQFPPVYRLQEVKPMLAQVKARYQAGDAMYVFFGARQAMAFYGAKYGFRTDQYDVGGCHHGAVRDYFTEVDRYRGRPRLWVLVSHDLDRYQERREIRNYLGRIGVLRDSVAIPGRPIAPFAVGAWAYLFDLSDSTRLAGANAAGMEVLNPRGLDPRLTCGWGPASGE